MADFKISNEELAKSMDDNNFFEEKKQKDTSWKTFMDKLNDFLFSIQKIKTKNKVIFYRLLSTMTNAWVSLLKSVSILEKQERDPILKRILWRFILELKEWRKLSDCMELFPRDFDSSEVWIIKSGEKIGLLNKSLTDLADQIEKIQSMSWKIKSAMIYPAFIILVVIIVVVIMMVKVVPSLLEMFGSKESLPFTTQVLITVSDLFVNYGFVMIWLVVILIIWFMIWKRTEDGRYIFDNFKMKIPVFWDIIQKTVLSKFSRVFSWLIDSWVSIVESLKITADAVWNEVYKQRILMLSQDVALGIKIWESIDWDKLFPPMMVQMIQVWEQTAKLESTISKVADFYDEQVDNVVAALNKLLEPFIIVVLAVVVWFIALWIMQPIMDMSNTISNM